MDRINSGHDPYRSLECMPHRNSGFTSNMRKAPTSPTWEESVLMSETSMDAHLVWNWDGLFLQGVGVCNVVHQRDYNVEARL